jgi:hypothetical protein
MLAHGPVLKRAGTQLARRNYVTTAPVRRSNLILYAGLAAAGTGLHAYHLNSIHCDSMRSTSVSLSVCVYNSPRAHFATSTANGRDLAPSPERSRPFPSTSLFLESVRVDFWQRMWYLRRCVHKERCKVRRLHVWWNIRSPSGDIKFTSPRPSSDVLLLPPVSRICFYRPGRLVSCRRPVREPVL